MSGQVADKRAKNGKSIIITGCSSGIGRALAVFLAKKGFTVFATVRKEGDAESLRALKLDRLVPVCPVDLTNRGHLMSLVVTVTQELQARGEDGLYALINNAGGGGIIPMELMDIDGFRTELETRLVGPMTLIQQLLPLLRRGRGRLLWITTPAIIPVAFVGSIHICDFAVNGIMRTLRLELKPWKIPLTMIRCGGIKTPSFERSYQNLDRTLQTLPEEKRRLYAGALKAEVAYLKQFDTRRVDAVEVAKTTYAALTAKKPNTRYQIGHMSRMATLLESMPQSLADFILVKRQKV